MNITYKNIHIIVSDRSLEESKTETRNFFLQRNEQTEHQLVEAALYLKKKEKTSVVATRSNYIKKQKISAETNAEYNILNQT